MGVSFHPKEGWLRISSSNIVNAAGSAGDFLSFSTQRGRPMIEVTQDETAAVSGGMFGGTGRYSPLDASATHEPGQNSYGETIPGGAAAYSAALAMGQMQIGADQHLADQIESCTTGNLLVCAGQTFQVLADQLGMAAAKQKP